MKLTSLITLAGIGLALSACTSSSHDSAAKASHAMSLQGDVMHNGASATTSDGTTYIALTTDSSYCDITLGTLIPTLTDYSVSVYYNVSAENALDGYGHFLFAFSALAANRATEGPYMAMRLNEQRFEVSTGGWENESVIQEGGKPARNVWHHALYRQAGTRGELYIDGQLIGTNPDMPILADLFADAPAYCWMGRAPFDGDKYLTKTRVAGFCLYEYAVSDDERDALVKGLSALK